MLVLSRKVGEKVCIGNGILVTVLSSAGGRVRLGFTAPRDVGIRRGELVPVDADREQSGCGENVLLQEECLVR